MRMNMSIIEPPVYGEPTEAPGFVKFTGPRATLPTSYTTSAVRQWLRAGYGDKGISTKWNEARFGWDIINTDCAAARILFDLYVW